MRVVLLCTAAALVMICGCVSTGVTAKAASERWWPSALDAREAKRSDSIALADAEDGAQLKLLGRSEVKRAGFAGPKVEVTEGTPAAEGERILFQQAAGDEGGAGKTKRMVIYNAEFLLSVYDLEACAKKIIELAQQAGGHVSSQTNEDIVIRVPAEKFKQVTEALPNIGRVASKSIEASDVTEEYLDVELRLSSKHKYLASLQELLGKAQDAKTMLEIQKEIGAVVEEIEALEGKLRYLKDQVAFSTITVHLELATAQAHREFSLPIDWIQTLGIEELIIVGGGAR